MSGKATPQVDRFFTGAEVRNDRWRKCLEAVRQWETAASKRAPEDAIRAEVTKGFKELREWEDFYAYPGPALLNVLSDRITAGDAGEQRAWCVTSAQP